ncbi:MAG: hypothetical protein ABSF03_29560 [Streptosporangiaceae bacterium]|jgi:hypothetical protein
MAGTITVDTGDTFATMLLMSIGPKLKFGTTEQDISASGERKYAAELAVTYVTEPGMRSLSEVISVTITGPGPDILDIRPGSLVELRRLRAGVSSPEKRDNGRIAGGRFYFMAEGIRLATVASGRAAASAPAA